MPDPAHDRRRRRCLEAAPGSRTVVDGREVDWFGGTAYLGLQSDPRVLRAAADAVLRYGVHSGTTRAVFGDSPPVLEAEVELAALFGVDRALLLPSGWMGPAVLCALLEVERPGARRVFVDSSSHWCGTEALRARGWPLESFAAHDPEDLRHALRTRARPGEELVVWCDGVVAGTGRIAPLGAYREVLAQATGGRGGALLVDDAHGMGCLGSGGRGTCELHGLPLAGEPDDDGVRTMVCGTASKALGGHGGVVLLRAGDWDRVWDVATVAPGASAPSAANAAATAAGARIVAAEPERRARLAARTRQLLSGLRDTVGGRAEGGGRWPRARSAPDPARVAPGTAMPVVGLSREQLGGRSPGEVAQALEREGLVVPWLPRYAAMPEGGLLRITVTSEHPPEAVDRLLAALAAALRA